MFEWSVDSRAGKASRQEPNRHVPSGAATRQAWQLKEDEERRQPPHVLWVVLDRGLSVSPTVCLLSARENKFLISIVRRTRKKNLVCCWKPNPKLTVRGGYEVVRFVERPLPPVRPHTQKDACVARVCVLSVVLACAIALCLIFFDELPEGTHAHTSSQQNSEPPRPWFHLVSSSMNPLSTALVFAATARAQSYNGGYTIPNYPFGTTFPMLGALRSSCPLPRRHDSLCPRPLIVRVPTLLSNTY